MTELFTSIACVLVILFAGLLMASDDDEPDPTDDELYRRARALWLNDENDPVWPSHRAPRDEDEHGPEWGGNPP